MAKKLLIEIKVDEKFDDLVRLKTEMERLKKDEQNEAKESGKT